MSEREAARMPSGKGNDHWDESYLTELFEALRSIRDQGEFSRFFDDLCTPAELRSMADRWRVAKLLDQGLSYRVINEKTGVSTATITRVARSLTYGTGGYRMVLQRQQGEQGE
ncbi:MAG TPA: YerC/YecD family TrpR-related protein [Oligoflexus sp.]|uniref:YerC/YecD family TrpR-related protein n=1 Tax=Oligoflexus sp. TaxID=1971216 RepID=UPI002D4E9A52|nr:YerC/YecD family TrpR-related protein [Oligoflexus sp.]HYX33998.1 YerC/YecD family TrpR-related protein [Oligoflexus sp.]